MASTLNASNAGSGGLISTADASGVLQLQSAGTTALTIDTAQKVGIGTTAPSYTLDIRGRTQIINTAAGTSTVATFGNDDTSGTSVVKAGFTSFGVTKASINAAVYGNDYMTFNVGSDTERMRIDSSGNVLIGVSSGYTSRLVVQGTASAASCDVGVGANGNNAFSFRNQSNSYVGQITVNVSSTAYTTTSDYRLKENIVPMIGALDKVALLKPVTYTWKSDGSDGQGFIAHELQAVIPDAVTGEKDAIDEEGNPKYQGIDTSFLVATLTASIQEQQTIINDLKARVTALEAK